MPSTGLEVWDKTIQTTHIWLDEIMEATGEDRHAAWHALGAVLRALRDRLPIEVAVHLGAQLPLLVRGTYYEQWHLAGPGVPVRGMEDFLDLVAAHLGRGRIIGPDAATAAVFRTMARHVDEGQVEKVLGVLPGSIRGALRAATA
jgi:uncharacterized protein (DUF2267 family)